MSSMSIENVTVSCDQIQYRVKAYDGLSPEYEAVFQVTFPSSVPGVNQSTFLTLADAFAEDVRSTVDTAWSSGNVTLEREFIPAVGTAVGLTDITP